MMATSWERTLSFFLPLSYAQQCRGCSGKAEPEGQDAQGKTSHPTGTALDRAGKKCENAGRDGENLWLFLGPSPSGIFPRHFFPVLSRVASGCRKKKRGGIITENKRRLPKEGIRRYLILK